MTITAQTSKTGPYSGNGSTAVFAYTFEVQDEAHLVVTLADADGNETTQALTTDYTVTGVGEASGGSITMSTAPATGERLTISRSIPLTQEVDLQNRGAVAPEVLEDAYDKLTQIVQDFSEQLGRSLKVSVASADPADLPTGDRAGQFLAFDASGDPTYASGTGADTDLRADLASGDAGKGASLIEYGGGTVEAALDGLVIGTDVQAFDAGLLSIAGLTTAANKMIYTTGSDTYAVADLTAAGRALLDDADTSAQRTTLGLGNIATTNLIDEDDMASDTAAQAPTQQSVKAYVDTEIAAYAIGVGQTWQDMTASRTTGTAYQNTTGRPIMIAITRDSTGAESLEISNDGVSWSTILSQGSSGSDTSRFQLIIPDGLYYRYNGGAATSEDWWELR